jgi:hypothetical protein
MMISLSQELWLAAALSVLMLGGVSWVAILRRRVRQHTGTIREWLRREAVLRKQYSDLFDNSTDTIYTHDLELSITSFNRAGELLTGYNRDEILAKKITDLLTPESAQRATEMYRRKLDGHQQTTYEVELVAKDGHRIPVEVSTSLIEEEGRIAGIQGAARDISERKRVEKEWRQAKEAAEAASRAKSEFLANVSHEIRTPLNGVIGMTQLLLETRPTEEQREYLVAIEASAVSLLKVIEDILDFSKIEARKLDLEAVEFSLHDTLREAVKSLAFQAQQKGLALRLEVLPGLPAFLQGDPARLRQVILNLLGNAIKFTEKGEVVLSVEKQSENLEEVSLHFSVRDTGIGVPTEKQQAIFEPFVQADGSHSRRFSGTGLGLAICSKLVSMMDGRIWLESEVNKGSTFHFTAGFRRLPPRLENVLPSDLQGLRRKESLPVPPVPAPNGRSLRILLVEDNEVNRIMVSRMLERHGHRVVAASDGGQAVATVRRSRCGAFDLILLDVQMPGIDGFETTAAIRAHELLSGGRAPIIALTACAMPGDRERCLDAGMDGYLAKPLQMHQLLDLLRDYGARPTETPWHPPDQLLHPETQPADPGPGPLDERTLLDHLEGNRQLLNSLIEVYLRQSPSLLAAAQRAFEERNGPALARAAHSLKGSVGSFLARSTIQTAALLEAAAEQADFPRAQESLAALQDELERLAATLRSLSGPQDTKDDPHPLGAGRPEAGTS